MTAIDRLEATPEQARGVLRLIARARAAGSGPGGSAVGAFAVRILGAGLGYGLHILLARMLGAAEFGLWAAAWTAILVAGHTVTGGFSDSIIRFLTGHIAREEWGKARGFLVVAFAVTFALSITLCALAVVGLRTLPNLVPAPLAGPLLIAAFALPAFAAQDLLEAAGRSLGRPVLALAPVFMLRPVVIVLGMTAASLSLPGVDAVVAMQATAGAIVVCVVVHALLIFSALPKPVRRARPEFETGGWIRGSAPLALVVVMDQLGAFADVLALAFTASPEETGAYFAAARVLSLVTLAPYAVTVVAARGFALHHARGEIEALRAFVRRTTRWTFFASVMLLVALLAGGPLLLSLFGRDFVSAAPALAVLSLALFARALSGHAEELLIATGNQNVHARIAVVVCVVAVIGCFSTAPLFGPVGVAWAMVLAATVRALLFVFAARRLTGFYTGIGLDVFTGFRRGAD